MKKYFLYLATVIFFGAVLTLNSCKKDDPPANDDQIAYDAADGVNGARLYDHVLDYKSIKDADMRAHSDFFRCKVCHAWDLKGQDGVGHGQKETATKPASADVMLVTDVRVNDDIRTIFDHIMNKGGRKSGTYNSTMPDYSEMLTEKDVWDLVKFIKETAHETDDFYTTTINADGSHSFSNIGKNGNAAAGLATYQAKCQSCHGADGSKINIYCKGEWLGDMFRNDPHEIQHKAVWGMPFDYTHSVTNGCADAGEMPATGITDDDIRNMMIMGQDETAFPDYTAAK